MSEILVCVKCQKSMTLIERLAVDWLKSKVHLRPKTTLVARKDEMADKVQISFENGINREKSNGGKMVYLAGKWFQWRDSHIKYPEVNKSIFLQFIVMDFCIRWMASWILQTISGLNCFCQWSFSRFTISGLIPRMWY